MVEENVQKHMEQKFPGIYYLTRLPFPTQVIVIKQLSKEENKWLSRLRTGLKVDEDLNVLAKEYRENQSDPLYSTCMDVILRANRGCYKKEGEVMCEAIRELMFEFYGDQIADERLLMVIRMVQKKIQKNKTQDQIREEMEGEEVFVSQLFQVIKELKGENGEMEILSKWKELFAS